MFERRPGRSADVRHWSVLDFGAKADGKTDDTSAFQKALDAAGQAGGGQVYAPRGNYFFSGHLNVPNAVTLKGMWESVPSHVGIRDRGSPKPTDEGTSFLVTENKARKMARFHHLNNKARSKVWSFIIPSKIRPKKPAPYPGPLPCAERIPRCSRSSCSILTTHRCHA